MEAIKELPQDGLNSLGFFDYSNDGVLLTPLSPDHQGFMEDTGVVSLGSDFVFVGVGLDQKIALARVSIVNEYGFCLYQTYVKPEQPVTCYRTAHTGIRYRHLQNATPFHFVSQKVDDLLRNHILVGYSVEHDFAALEMYHRKAFTRDTRKFFKEKLLTDRDKKPGLGYLTEKFLGVHIHEGNRNPITDAQAAMALYLKFREEWEKSVGVCESERRIKPATCKLALYTSVHSLPGMNEYGFFTYNRQGVLCSPTLTTHHSALLEDRGVLSLSCDKVGVGPKREDEALARVSIVNEFGYCVYDRFVKPERMVTCYRTPATGIKKRDLKNATRFTDVRKEVVQILDDHIIIGHRLLDDLTVLNYSHPAAQRRDIADYFQRSKVKPELRDLVKQQLGVEIEDDERSSITDAQAGMALYLLNHTQWEQFIRQKSRADIFKRTLDNLKIRRILGTTKQSKFLRTDMSENAYRSWALLSKLEYRLCHERVLTMSTSTHTFLIVKFMELHLGPMTGIIF